MAPGHLCWALEESAKKSGGGGGDCPETLVFRVVTLQNISVRAELYLSLLEMLVSFGRASIAWFHFLA